MNPTISKKIEQTAGESARGSEDVDLQKATDIKIDLPFVLSQAASILANQLADGYLQVAVLNVALIAAAKAVFFVRRIIVMRLKHKPDR